MGRKHTYATKSQLETLVRRMHTTGILYYEALEEFKKQFILVVLRSLRELHIDNRALRNAERRPPHGTRTPQQNRDVG